MQVQPYLFFNGQCDEAIEFYTRALGAKVKMLMRYKECPEAGHSIGPEMAEKVMHASLSIGESIVSVSDGRCQGGTSFDGFSLTLSVKSDADADRAFKAIAEGGKVSMPLGKTFFSSRFGMASDRFGVPWMVIVQA